MATEQVKEGAHILDVCVDYVGRDGAADMDEIASRFATQVNAPLMLDSTEPNVRRSRAAVDRRPAHPQLASTSRTATHPAPASTRSYRSPATYGAAVVCTCIDEQGQAR